MKFSEYVREEIVKRIKYDNPDMVAMLAEVLGRLDDGQIEDFEVKEK